MTIQVTSVYTRPGPDVAWHEPIMLNKKLTKKYQNKRVVVTESITETVLTIKTIWQSAEDRAAFESEPEIASQYEAIREYHESVGIIAEPKIVIEEI